MLRYRLKIEPDDNGTLLVTSPDIPIATYGDDFGAALRNAQEAIVAMLTSMMEAREDIPVPVIPAGDTTLQCRLPLQTALKIGLYQIMKGTGQTRADLQRSLGWQRESVDRLFRLDHNSRLDQIEAAYRALNKVIDIHVQDAPARAA